MAISSMVVSRSSRSSSVNVVPLAFRVVSRSAGSLNGSISTTTTTIVAAAAAAGVSRQFSITANTTKFVDSNLVKAIRSEIKIAKKSCSVEQKDLPKPPPAFVFTIQDNEGERAITLTQEFPDETVAITVKQAEVEKVVAVEEENDSDDDDDSSDDDKGNDNKVEKNDEKCCDSDSCDCRSSNSDDDISSEEEDGDDSQKGKKKAPSLPMTVTVAKKDGRLLKFEISASVDEINVKHMSVGESAPKLNSKVELSGPDFEKLDHHLKHSLLKYLEIRGVRSNFIHFLHKYMAAKSQKDDMVWLDKLKNFVKN